MSKSAPKFDVILLKSSEENENDSVSPSLPKKQDKYVSYLLSNDENGPHSLLNRVDQVNLLKFAYCNLQALYDALNSSFRRSDSSPMISSHKCLILTSRQAVEALQQAFSSHKSDVVDRLW